MLRQHKPQRKSQNTSTLRTRKTSSKSPTCPSEKPFRTPRRSYKSAQSAKKPSVIDLLLGRSHTKRIPLDQPFPLDLSQHPTGPIPAPSHPHHDDNDTTTQGAKDDNDSTKGNADNDEIQAEGMAAKLKNDAESTANSKKDQDGPKKDQPTTISKKAPPSSKFLQSAPSQSKLLSSYRHAVFSKGTIVSTANTSTSLPLSSITMSIDIGSRYESPSIQGLTHILSKSFLRSTSNRVTGTLHRDMAKLGVELVASADREKLILTANTPSDRITPIIGTMFDLVLNHTFDFVDLRDDILSYQHDLEAIEKNNFAQFQELLHHTAFGSSTVGLPLYPKSPLSHDSILPQLSPKLLSQWSRQFFTANRISFSAVNVEHKSFMALMETLVHKLPGSTLNNFKPPLTSYMAKESHLTHRDIYNVIGGVDCGNAGVGFEDYTGNPFDYLNEGEKGMVEQHVGLAYLAPHPTHQDSPIFHVINSILSTKMIYGIENDVDYMGKGRGVGQSPLTMSKTHNNYSVNYFSPQHHLSSTSNHFSSHVLSSPIRPNFSQQWDLNAMVPGSEGSNAKDVMNPMLQFRNNNGMSPFLTHFDTNYQSYHDSGLLLLHSVLPTTSLHARNENIGFMQYGLESLGSSTVLSDKLIQFHKNKVLFSLSRHFSSNISHVSSSLASHSTQLQFDERVRLAYGYDLNGKGDDLGLEQKANPKDTKSQKSSEKSTKSDKTISGFNQRLKYDITVHHDPIDELYKAVQNISVDDVRRVIDNVISSTPTIVSYTAPIYTMGYGGYKI